MRWLAATLTGLLALAYAIVRLGAPSAAVRPAPDDPGVGGLSLFAQALRDAGYRVAFEPSSRPKLARDEIAIVPILGERPTPAPVLDHVRAGGRALALAVPERLQRMGDLVTMQDSHGREATVDATFPTSDPLREGEIAAVPIWTLKEIEPAELSQVGKGRLARLAVGALATNRFLGRRDNARVVFSTLRALRPKPGERLTFLALGYGETEDPGPIEAIGPWAVGALWQTLAVLAAFGVARGVRFGLAAPEARTRRGSRDLLDALAGHYRRARRTDAPLLAAARERPDDAEIQAVAARPVSEAEARQALIALEERPKPRRK